MALSRPLVLALLGVILVPAAFLATRGARESDDGGASAAPARTRATADPRPSRPRPPKSRGRPGAETRRPGPSSRPSQRSRRASSLPAPFARAIARRQVVVLLFFQRGSADDRAALAAVAEVRGTRGVALFTEPVERLARYGDVTRSVAISQVPATLIVGRDRKARLLEGLVDGQTLRQAVRDAR